MYKKTIYRISTENFNLSYHFWPSKNQNIIRYKTELPISLERGIKLNEMNQNLTNKNFSGLFSNFLVAHFFMLEVTSYEYHKFPSESVETHQHTSQNIYTYIEHILRAFYICSKFTILIHNVSIFSLYETKQMLDT